MTYKNVQNIVLLNLVAILAVSSFIAFNDAYAEDETKYKMAEDVDSILTFKFRDGMEVHNFPVFVMGENIVDNNGASFQVQGIVEEAPYLHKALDEAYNYRLLKLTGGSSFEYNYRFFDVNVDFVKDNKVVKTLNYSDCEVDDYEIETLNDGVESYMSSSTGFSIVDQITFNCGGLHFDDSPIYVSNVYKQNQTEYVGLDYKFANDVRTYISFEFDGGIERIEFPFFELISGFSEDDNRVTAEFMVEGVVADYPLLWNAINSARQLSGTPNGFNTDFEAHVEFVQNNTTIRALDFRDCHVSEAEVTTQTDKEEGFTGKSGFALVNQIGFECSGLTPVNPTYNSMKSNASIWNATHLTNDEPLHTFSTTNNVHAITTFTYANGREVIDFPLFTQGVVLSRSYPTFELGGIVGDYPLLYKVVDENLKMQSQSGANTVLELFQVNVSLLADDKLIRSFDYKDCRTTDYVVTTQRNKEESYFKGFALSNTFEFECHGYHPNGPIYDAMFSNYKKADTISTSDLINTAQWGPGFYIP